MIALNAFRRWFRWQRALLTARFVRRWSALRRGLTLGAPIFAARIHGRGSLLYLQGGAAAAVPFSNAANYSIDISFGTEDVSVLGDDWQTFIRGMLGFTGSFDGPYDTASTTAWDALTATSERKFYLYPDKTSLTQYYYGTAWVDVSVKGGVGSPVTFSSKVTGTGILSKNP